MHMKVCVNKDTSLSGCIVSAQNSVPNQGEQSHLILQGSGVYRAKQGERIHTAPSPCRSRSDTSQCDLRGAAKFTHTVTPTHQHLYHLRNATRYLCQGVSSMTSTTTQYCIAFAASQSRRRDAQPISTGYTKGCANTARFINHV
jgi:hypothetical protein